MKYFIKTITVTLFLLALSTPCWAQGAGLSLFDGESADQQTANNNPANWYGSVVAHDASQGTHAFQGNPDNWHSPTINLAGTALDSDISAYDEIWFYAKASQTGHAISFSIYGWPYTSNAVDLTPYIQGGVLDTTYRLVKIPLSVLKTTDYSLSKVSRFFFGVASPANTTYQIYVDDFRVLKTQPLQLKTAKILSNTVVKLTVNDDYDMNGALTLSNYALASTTDGDFGSGRAPTAVGRQKHLVDFTDQASPVVSYELYLVFDRSMKNGNTYNVNVTNILNTGGINFPATQTLAITFNDQTEITGTVKANQVGYLPASPKFAYMGNYIGDQGKMPLSPSNCEVRNASTNAAVLTVPARFRGDDFFLSGERVYDCDFSALTTTGNYYIYVAGLGRTYNFRIAPDVFKAVYRTSIRMFMYQRANIKLDAQYAGIWAREAGTPQDFQSVKASCDPYPSLDGAGDPAGGTIIDLSHGWYDAGDFGKYVLAAAQPIWNLLTAYDLFPEKFGDDLNIPESGNGIPDILDEVKWEIDWLRNMQAPDGGVWDRATSKDWLTGPFDNSGPTKIKKIAPKTTQTTADYAALLALSYRLFKANAAFESKYPGYADDLLVRAKKAWSFLQAHVTVTPAAGFQLADCPEVGGGDYVDPDGDTDGRAWAAAELYKATGDQNYHNSFKTLWAQNDPYFGYNAFQHYQQEASFAYATSKNRTLDATIVSKIKVAMKANTDLLVTQTNNNLYRNGYRSDVLQWIGWGAFAQSTIRSWEMIKTYYILGDASYLNPAMINLDSQLGNNPLYISFITGVGTDYPRDPLHIISETDGVVEPVPGIPIFGPHYHMSEANYFDQKDQQNRYPSVYVDDQAQMTNYNYYPVLRRYTDTHELVEMSEFGLGSIAPASIVFAFFSPNVTAGGAPTAPKTFRVVP